MIEIRDDRRRILKALSLATCNILASRRAWSDSGANDPAASPHIDPILAVSGARVGPDTYRAIALTESGKPGQSCALPGRAHGSAVHARRGIGCLFARRPGNWFCTFDTLRIDQASFVEAAPGRFFSGHGTYSADGALLYTTESDFEQQRGIVGVYETGPRYRRVGEIDTGGVGPHEVIRAPGTKLLVVANGGIATHPHQDGGRQPLNLDSMQPSIAVLDARDGTLLSRHVLPAQHHKVSLRHLAFDGRGRVWYAAQMAHDIDTPFLADPDARALPLVGYLELQGRHGRMQEGGADKDHALNTVPVPQTIVPQRHAYLSSVAADSTHVLYTSARDGVAFRIDARRRKLDGVAMLPDCSGVAAVDALSTRPCDADRSSSDSTGFLLSTGLGETHVWRGAQVTRLASATCDWDNHLTALL